MSVDASTATATETPNPAPPAADPASKAPDVTAAEKLIAKHDSAPAAVLALMSENYKARDKARELESKLPPAGSVVLTDKEAASWEQYRTLGKPEDLRAKVAEHGTNAAELAALKREGELRGVAEKAGVQFVVLKTLAGSLDFSSTVKAKDKAGKEVDVPAVKDGDADPVAFDAYAARHWAAFLPALKPEAARGAPLGTPRAGAAAPRVAPAVARTDERPARRSSPLS